MIGAVQFDSILANLFSVFDVQIKWGRIVNLSASNCERIQIWLNAFQNADLLASLYQLFLKLTLAALARFQYWKYPDSISIIDHSYFAPECLFWSKHINVRVSVSNTKMTSNATTRGWSSAFVRPKFLTTQNWSAGLVKSVVPSSAYQVETIGFLRALPSQSRRPHFP